MQPRGRRHEGERAAPSERLAAVAAVAPVAGLASTHLSERGVWTPLPARFVFGEYRSGIALGSGLRAAHLSYEGWGAVPARMESPCLSERRRRDGFRETAPRVGASRSGGARTAELTTPERSRSDPVVRREGRVLAARCGVPEHFAAAWPSLADEEVEARVIAATNQARPATEAVAATPARAARAMRARGTARVKDRSRSR
jgi:hypothetical protein